MSAAAAAARMRMLREEEEVLTSYGLYRPDQPVQYKIVRSAFGRFGSAAGVREACEEEARTGWHLLEKFDNNRLRFVRPTGEGAMSVPPPAWEFKIVRANLPVFKNEENVAKICAEEAENGWELLERFDGCRLRFKRATSARGKVSTSGIDPYRTKWGLSDGAFAALIFLIVIVVMGITMAIAVSTANRRQRSSPPPDPIPIHRFDPPTFDGLRPPPENER